MLGRSSMRKAGRRSWSSIRRGGDEFQKLTKEVAQQRLGHGHRPRRHHPIRARSPIHDKYPDGIFGSPRADQRRHMTEKESRALASALQNPLQTPVVIEEERSASSTLGVRRDQERHLRRHRRARGRARFRRHFTIASRSRLAVVGLVGKYSSCSSGAMSMFGFVLTLPGHRRHHPHHRLAWTRTCSSTSGFAKKCRRQSLGAAIEAAYNKAFSVIFDANATTLITAAILFWQATGPIKGFAVTLVVGIIASVFSAMVVTRMLFSWALKFGETNFAS